MLKNEDIKITSEKWKIEELKELEKFFIKSFTTFKIFIISNQIKDGILSENKIFKALLQVLGAFFNKSNQIQRLVWKQDKSPPN